MVQMAKLGKSPQPKNDTYSPKSKQKKYPRTDKGYAHSLSIKKTKLSLSKKSVMFKTAKVLIQD